MPASWNELTLPTGLAAAEVHVWRLHLELADETLDSLEPLLTDDELARANRYRFEKHRRRYVACRGQVRQIVASYLNAHPSRIAFDYGKLGKPFLAEPWNESGLQFNVSHSDTMGLCGIATHREIGVDIETIRLPSDYEGIANQFFAREEIAALAALPAEARLVAFFTCWTRKEAVLKAVGTGLSIPLNQVVVTVGTDEPARVITFIDPRGTDQKWWIEHLEPGTDQIGAVASPGGAFKTVCGEWNPRQKCT